MNMRSNSAIFTFAADLRRRMIRDYQDLAEAQYEAALEGTGGVMTNALCEERGYTSRAVYEAHAATIAVYGSRELQDYLEHTPRVTRTAFEAQWLENYLGENPNEN